MPRIENTISHDAGVAEPPTTGPSLQLSLPATCESLGVIRTHFSDFVNAQLGDQSKHFPMDEVVLALQEACANVVRHAYGDSEGPIAVRVDVEPKVLRITVIDRGPGYDPTQVGPPDFENPTDGGYGVHLIREIMSDLRYRRTSLGNELIMEKELTEDAPSC